MGAKKLTNKRGNKFSSTLGKMMFYLPVTDLTAHSVRFVKLLLNGLNYSFEQASVIVEK